MPSISATARDEWLSGLKIETEEQKDKFLDEFAKEPYTLSRIEEKQGKTVIRTFLANSDKGKELIKKKEVELPNYILFGVEKIPTEKMPQFIKQEN